MSLSQTFTNLSSDNIPAFVVFDLMYRDGDNWKTTQAYGFANDEKLTVAQIAAWFEAHMPTEDILAKRYELPNLAPIDNEHDICDGHDHCYMELSELDICDHLSPFIEKGDTPFSVIYHNAINASSPKMIQCHQQDELNVVLARVKDDLRTLSKDFNGVEPAAFQAALKATILPEITTLAEIGGKKMVDNTAQIVKSYEVAIPADLDFGLFETIINSAMNYPKGRRELIAHYGEKRIVDFHAKFLDLASRQTK